VRTLIICNPANRNLLRIDPLAERTVDRKEAGTTKERVMTRTFALLTGSTIILSSLAIVVPADAARSHAYYGHGPSYTYPYGYTSSQATARHANGHNNVRHVRHAVERAHGFVPGQVRRYDPRTDVYSSESLGHQSFPNPDRDFSIENLSSHAQ
jgi:hypothetical protein